MRLSWNDKQRELRDRYARFGREVVAPGSAERDHLGSFDHAGWKALADEGFWRVHVPVAYGGAGGDLWDFVAAFEGLALGAGDCGFVLSATAHAGLMQVLLTDGTDEQRTRLLPRLMTGAVGATAATEPTGGSHVAKIGSIAFRDGADYLLSGQKAHITNAPIADVALIVGRVAGIGKRDITLFLVDRDQDGVTLGEHEDLLGQRTSPTGPIMLDNVRITAANVVGPLGEGLATLYSFLAFDRLMYGIVVASLLESLLPVALERVATRTAFGVPLAEHELIQDKIVAMTLVMENARYLAYSAVNALTEGDDRFSLLASCAKLAASEGVVQSTLELIQLFGHLGYDRAAGIERHLRDAVAIRLAGGTTEMQKKNIFRHVYGRRQAASG